MDTWLTVGDPTDIALVAASASCHEPIILEGEGKIALISTSLTIQQCCILLSKEELHTYPTWQGTLFVTERNRDDNPYP